MAISQDTLLDLSKRIKQQLKSGLYKADEETIERTKKAKAIRISNNRSFGQKIRYLKKELYSGKPTKMEAKEMLNQINWAKKQYKPPGELQNIIDKQEGNPFYFNIKLGGFTKAKVSSESFEKEDIGIIEKQLMNKWKISIEEGIDKAETEEQKENIQKILNTVIAHILYFDGQISGEDLDAELKFNKLYPVLQFTNMATAQIDIFATGGKKKK